MTKFINRNEEIILLAILKLKGNAYGVSIRQQIHLDMGDKWSFASIYQPLDNLVRKKYIRRIKGDPTSRRGGKSMALDPNPQISLWCYSHKYPLEFDYV